MRDFEYFEPPSISQAVSLLSKYKEKAKVIATGSYAEVIARETPVIEIVNPHLTLIGLNLIHQLNKD